MHSPLVTVMIPTFNQSRYIAQTVESVLSQSYQNLQVIIGDDNSTDNTEKIVKPYLDDPRVQHIKNSHKLYPEIPIGTPIKLVLIGNIDVPKGVEVLCKIANRLGERLINFSLVLYGQGGVQWDTVFLPMFSSEAKEMISFLGQVPLSSITHILSKCHVLLNPSRYESFGLTVAEAQVLGLPVIVNNYSEAYETLENDTSGFICSSADVDIWVEHICELAGNPDLYTAMSKHSLLRGRKLFNMNTITKNSINVYKDVLAKDTIFKND